MNGEEAPEETSKGAKGSNIAKYIAIAVLAAIAGLSFFPFESEKKLEKNGPKLDDAIVDIAPPPPPPPIPIVPRELERNGEELNDTIFDIVESKTATPEQIGVLRSYSDELYTDEGKGIVLYGKNDVCPAADVYFTIHPDGKLEMVQYEINYGGGWESVGTYGSLVPDELWPDPRGGEQLYTTRNNVTTCEADGQCTTTTAKERAGQNRSPERRKKVIIPDHPTISGDGTDWAAKEKAKGLTSEDCAGERSI